MERRRGGVAPVEALRGGRSRSGSRPWDAGRRRGERRGLFERVAREERAGARSEAERYLVDPASSHMLVSKIKPCMSKYKRLYSETANGSLNQL